MAIGKLNGVKGQPPTTMSTIHRCWLRKILRVLEELYAEALSSSSDVI